jgi:hypothetical protein
MKDIWLGAAVTFIRRHSSKFFALLVGTILDSIQEQQGIISIHKIKWIFDSQGQTSWSKIAPGSTHMMWVIVIKSPTGPTSNGQPDA